MANIERKLKTVKPQQVGELKLAEQKPSIVSLGGVVLRYQKQVTALSEVSLEIPAEQCLAVMGPSGSGKSSLLAVIAGRRKPEAGWVSAPRSIATIHQDLRLVCERTALENVLHGAMGRHTAIRTLFGFPFAERKRATSLLCRVGLEAKVHTPVKRLSGGERQRVAIARALMQDPAVLLADEPVAALDEETAHDIMSLIRGLAAERKLTVVNVMHDYALANTYCDRVVRLVDGRFVYDQKARHIPRLSERDDGVVDGPREVTSQRQILSSIHEIPKPPTGVAFLGAIIVAAIVYAWAFSGLEIKAEEWSGSFGSVFYFLKELIPSSIAEITAIPWAILLSSLAETLQMALIGTTLGVLISWPIAGLAAKNLGPSFVRPIVRFVLNMIRTVPSLIWALLFVAAVGLGTTAGILALVAYSVGYLTKFFYEAFESVDPGPPDALREIGASGLQRFLHAVWPAAKPAVLSSSLFMLEYNVRAASLLGIVGAGGIGFYIKQYIDFRAFPSVTASLLLLLVVVVAFDYVSSRVREKLLEV